MTEENPSATAAAARMAELGLTQAEVAERAKVDEGTISDFLNNRRRPRRGTLAKLDAALGLTPGTLAGAGEEAKRITLGKSALGGSDTLGPDLSRVSNQELVGEISARLRQLRERIRELEPAAEREFRRASERATVLAGITEQSSQDERWLAKEWARLQAEAQGGDLGPDDAELLEALCDWLDVLAWEARQANGPSVPAPDPRFGRAVLNSDDALPRAARTPRLRPSKSRPPYPME